jgi:lipid A 4'-phosphatase
MVRGWLLAMGIIAVVLGAVFAAYPQIDIEVASRFFDYKTGKFPLAHSDDWLEIRQILNWVPYLFMAPAVFALLRKIWFPNSRMLIAPSVVFFLIGTVLAGPALTSNLILKENWGRPRPNHVTQFSGSAKFQPWWRPGGDCPRNCSFVSGEASQAYWLIAPAMLAPPQVRVVAMGAAVAFGTAVGGLRVVFGRHFVSDVVFAAVITIGIVMGFYWLLLSPTRRNDARLEKAIESMAIKLHGIIGRTLIGAGTSLSHFGRTLRHSGGRLQNRPPPNIDVHE